MKERVDATELESMKQQLKQALSDLQAHSNFARYKQLVIGCSTSEVVGEQIGTAGTLEVAEAIFHIINQFSKEHDIAIAYQCCEHLNRALVVETSTMEKFGYEEVCVVPVQAAGGALATCAYQNLNEAVLVEHIRAEAGIDIGDTFIGMHLKQVAVPVRSITKNIGKAHLTMAVSRPKLIGGVRSVYGDIDR
ncbi:TIGR01440 family protein [Bacillus sp. JJ722]|uniref:TIGR01440 family protein n=1 Tax=Bacillus sp. JJ722 TaxID=3122973 RepID=UPI002FFF15A4